MPDRVVAQFGTQHHQSNMPGSWLCLQSTQIPLIPIHLLYMYPTQHQSIQPDNNQSKPPSSYTYNIHISFHHLVCLELCSNSPALVICQSVPVLLKQRVDTWNSSVPAVLQIFKCKTPNTNEKFTNQPDWLSASCTLDLKVPYHCCFVNLMYM